MKCRVLFSDIAKKSIREISEAVKELSGSGKIAAKLARSIKEECKILEDFPESGSFPIDYKLRNEGYRFLVHKDYLIFYTYEKSKNEVSIISVMNAKLDYVRVMKKFL